jgi:hypothetical protein
MNEIAAERAREFGIAGQQAGESDYAFGHRVALELRRDGHIIEAHEAESGHLYDDPQGDAVTGIMGAVAQTMQGRSYSGDRINNDYAAGVVASHPRNEAGDAPMVAFAMLLGGR